MSGELSFIASETGDGTLRITAFSDDSTEPIELEVDERSAGPLRAALDEALRALDAGRDAAIGPVRVSNAEVTATTSGGRIRLTVERTASDS